MMSNAVKYVMLNVITAGLSKGKSVQEIFSMYSRLSKEDKEELLKIVNKK